LGGIHERNGLEVRILPDLNLQCSDGFEG